DRWVQGVASLLGSASRARLGVEIGAEHVTLNGELQAEPGAELERWLEQTRPGALDAALAMPAEVSFAIAAAGSEPGRAGTAAALARTFREVFGARLPPQDAVALETALVDLAESRGDRIAFGVSLEPVPQALLSVDVRDAAAFDRAIEQLL